MRIFEVLEHGPIMAQNEETRIVVTMNGTELKAWKAFWMDQISYNELSTKDIHLDNGLFGISMSDAMDKADEWLQELVAKELE